MCKQYVSSREGLSALEQRAKGGRGKGGEAYARGHTQTSAALTVTSRPYPYPARLPDATVPCDRNWLTENSARLHWNVSA